MIVVTITGSFFGLRRRTRTVAQIMGVARNVKLDSQSEPKWRGGTPYTEYTYILRFRVEQYDESGNRVRIVAVEMRASSFEGFINEGDRVEVFGQWTGGLLQAEEIRDHTTGVGFALPKRR